MAHRHPMKLNAEHVTHSEARRLLRAELANCGECRVVLDRSALRDLEPDGVFDSLLHGFLGKRSEQWRTRHSRYPVTLYGLAPPPEARFLNLPTQEVARLCVIEGRAGDRFDTGAALGELRTLSDGDRALVLGDVVDGILEDEG
ncbi:hypothetical protein HNR23_004843 [Nocardiopsis mwathae]|uniref:Uncharacterized protein n=1 Tax=Nocardiopsis mwathae TaxID=1472723 RepID=A0A7X0D7S7_9ACTN|nr:hypothetical protein [Nocardiopsis mwathae]MBB6174783.1 hypothetical protein [Nocardiopsis mwathae]